MLNGIVRLFTGGLLGKVLGLLRESVLAYYFGASDVTAASRVANTAVLNPLNLLTADTLSGAFLPLETTLLREDASAAYRLYRSIQIVFFLLGVTFAVISVFAAERWVSFIAPGFDADLVEVSASIMIAMAFGAPSYLFYNMLCYLDMAHEQFKLPSWRATAQSLGMIAGVVAAFYLDMPSMIGWGFSGAYICLAVAGSIYSSRRRYFVQGIDYSARRAALVLLSFFARVRMLILLPVLSLASIITERMVASEMGVMTVAVVDYARLITETGLLLLATPVGLASLSTFAIIPAAVARSRFARILEPFLLVAIPAAALTGLFAPVLIELLFARGAFDEDSVAAASGVLRGLSVGLWAQAGVYVIVKVMNAQRRNAAAVLVMAVAVTITIAVRLPLAQWLGEFGLGLSVSAGFVVAVILGTSLMRAWRILLLCVVYCVPGVFMTYIASSYASDVSTLTSLAVISAVCVGWGLLYVSMRRPRHVMLEVWFMVTRRGSRREGADD